MVVAIYIVNDTRIALIRSLLGVIFNNKGKSDMSAAVSQCNAICFSIYRQKTCKTNAFEYFDNMVWCEAGGPIVWREGQ